MASVQFLKEVIQQGNVNIQKSNPKFITNSKVFLEALRYLISLSDMINDRVEFSHLQLN